MRPLLNLSSEAFVNVMNNAFGKPLVPPFDPYANPLNFLRVSYVVPYVRLTGYVGAKTKLQSPTSSSVNPNLNSFKIQKITLILTNKFIPRMLLLPKFWIKSTK